MSLRIYIKENKSLIPALPQGSAHSSTISRSRPETLPRKSEQTDLPQKQPIQRNKPSHSTREHAISPQSNVLRPRNQNQSPKANQFDQLQNAIEEKNNRIQQLQKQLDDHLHRNSQLAAQLTNDGRKNRQAIEEEMGAIRQKLEEGSCTEDELKNIVKASDEMVINLMKENEQLNELLNEKINDVEVLQEKMTALEQKFNEEEDQEKAYQQSYKQHAELESKLNALAGENDVLNEERMRLQEANRKLQDFADKLLKQVQSNNPVIQDEVVLAQIENLERKIDELERVNRHLEDIIRQRDAQIEELTATLNRLTQNYQPTRTPKHGLGRTPSLPQTGSSAKKSTGQLHGSPLAAREKIDVRNLSASPNKQPGDQQDRLRQQDPRYQEALKLLTRGQAPKSLNESNSQPNLNTSQSRLGGSPTSLNRLYTGSPGSGRKQSQGQLKKVPSASKYDKLRGNQQGFYDSPKQSPTANKSGGFHFDKGSIDPRRGDYYHGGYQPQYPEEVKDSIREEGPQRPKNDYRADVPVQNIQMQYMSGPERMQEEGDIQIVGAYRPQKEQQTMLGDTSNRGDQKYKSSGALSQSPVKSTPGSGTKKQTVTDKTSPFQQHLQKPKSPEPQKVGGDGQQIRPSPTRDERKEVGLRGQPSPQKSPHTSSGKKQPVSVAIQIQDQDPTRARSPFEDKGSLSHSGSVPQKLVDFSASQPKLNQPMEQSQLANAGAQKRTPKFSEPTGIQQNQSPGRTLSPKTSQISLTSGKPESNQPNQPRGQITLTLQPESAGNQLSQQRPEDKYRTMPGQQGLMDRTKPEHMYPMKDTYDQGRDVRGSPLSKLGDRREEGPDVIGAGRLSNETGGLQFDPKMAGGESIAFDPERTQPMDPRYKSYGTSEQASGQPTPYSGTQRDINIPGQRRPDAQDVATTGFPVAQKGDRYKSSGRQDPGSRDQFMGADPNKPVYSSGREFQYAPYNRAAEQDEMQLGQYPIETQAQQPGGPDYGRGSEGGRYSQSPGGRPTGAADLRNENLYPQTQGPQDRQMYGGEAGRQPNYGISSDPNRRAELGGNISGSQPSRGDDTGAVTSGKPERVSNTQQPNVATNLRYYNPNERKPTTQQPTTGADFGNLQQKERPESVEGGSSSYPRRIGDAGYSSYGRPDQGSNLQPTGTAGEGAYKSSDKPVQYSQGLQTNKGDQPTREGGGEPIHDKGHLDSSPGTQGIRRGDSGFQYTGKPQYTSAMQPIRSGGPGERQGYTPGQNVQNLQPKRTVENEAGPTSITQQQPIRGSETGYKSSGRPEQGSDAQEGRTGTQGPQNQYNPQGTANTYQPRASYTSKYQPTQGTDKGQNIGTAQPGAYGGSAYRQPDKTNQSQDIQPNKTGNLPGNYSKTQGQYQPYKTGEPGSQGSLGPDQTSRLNESGSQFDKKSPSEARPSYEYKSYQQTPKNTQVSQYTSNPTVNYRPYGGTQGTEYRQPQPNTQATGPQSNQNQTMQQPSYPSLTNTENQPLVQSQYQPDTFLSPDGRDLNPLNLQTSEGQQKQHPTYDTATGKLISPPQGSYTSPTDTRGMYAGPNKATTPFSASLNANTPNQLNYQSPTGISPTNQGYTSGAGAYAKPQLINPSDPNVTQFSPEQQISSNINDQNNKPLATSTYTESGPFTREGRSLPPTGNERTRLAKSIDPMKEMGTGAMGRGPGYNSTMPTDHGGIARSYLPSPQVTERIPQSITNVGAMKDKLSKPDNYMFKSLEPTGTQDSAMKNTTGPMYYSQVDPHGGLRNSMLALVGVQDLAGLCDELAAENERLRALAAQNEETIRNYSDVFNKFEVRNESQMEAIRAQYQEKIKQREREINEIKKKLGEDV